MRAASIVEIEISPDRLARVRHAVVGAQVDLLVFDRPPEALDEHVVPSRALAVHADADLVPGKQPEKAWQVNCEPGSVLKISGLP
jgi:hypothetical protein